jgi:hypothetical protein
MIARNKIVTVCERLVGVLTELDREKANKVGDVWRMNPAGSAYPKHKMGSDLPHTDPLSNDAVQATEASVL